MYLIVDLAGVGLTGHAQRLVEAHHLRHATVQLSHFVVIAVEELQT
jgi:hypothetical protein